MPNLAVKSVKGRRNASDPVSSLWHRFERSWPFTRIKKPVDLYLFDNILLAGVPVPGPGDWHDNMVNLEFVKQGTFRGNPATLLSVHIAHWIERDVRQSCVELRVGPAPNADMKLPRLKDSKVVIAAYGPAYVTRPVLPSANPPTKEQLERIEVFPTKRGIMIHCLENALQPTGVHPSFSVALVIVHSVPAILTTFITSSDRRRALVPRRSWSRPLIIDEAGEREPFPSTCGWTTHCGLGERCTEFGPEHMTAAIWNELGREGVSWMEGDGPEASLCSNSSLQN